MLKGNATNLKSCFAKQPALNFVVLKPTEPFITVTLNPYHKHPTKTDRLTLDYLERPKTWSIWTYGRCTNHVSTQIYSGRLPLPHMIDLIMSSDCMIKLTANTTPTICSLALIVILL